MEVLAVVMVVVVPVAVLDVVLVFGTGVDTDLCFGLPALALSNIAAGVVFPSEDDDDDDDLEFVLVFNL